MKSKSIYIVFMFFLLGCGPIPVISSQSFLGKEERFQKRIRIGMTMEQVKTNWGVPDKIIRKQSQDFDEIWIYIPHWKFKNYLYFKDDVLIRGNPNPENLI